MYMRWGETALNIHYNKAKPSIVGHCTIRCSYAPDYYFMVLRGGHYTKVPLYKLQNSPLLGGCYREVA